MGAEAESAVAEDPTIELAPNVKSQLVKNRLAKVHIAVGTDVTSNIVEEFPLMAEYEVYAKGMHWSPGHHSNMIGNLIREMSYYTEGKPYTFHPNMLNDSSTLFSLVSSLEEAGCKSETIKKYMEAVRSFFRFLHTDLKYESVHTAIGRLDRYAETVQKRKTSSTTQSVRLD